ncbi:MAG: hypothetical protein OHK0023_11900 [Anaerolineae bacterium]
MANLFKRFMRPPDPARLPRLTLAQRVVDKIVANALIYQTETGESLVGLAIPNNARLEPDLYVIDTIAPDDTAVRAGAYFEQGDDLQGDIFNWLHDNWEQMRVRARVISSDNILPKWDAPLLHLGDWHKHPGTLVEPSWGDTATAREVIHDRDANTPQILVILATVWQKFFSEVESLAPASAEEMVDEATDEFPEDLRPDLGEAPPLYVPVDAGDLLVRIDCWYMSRNIRRFTRLAPLVVPNADLPSLPIVGWHLSQPERLRSEVELLTKAGYSVSVEQFDTDRVPPQEICFSVAKRNSPNVIIVITEADFPKGMPRIRVTPMATLREIPEDSNIFDHLWNRSQPLAQTAYPTWTWSETHTLLELVSAVEAHV